VSHPRPHRRLLGATTLAAATLASALLIAHHVNTASATLVAAPKLHIEEVGADSTAFDVVATIITGPTEALLWDTQYHVADARRLADRIAASGKHLTAIVLSHPDHDHFAGAAVLVERFPGTPVYMTAKALDAYRKTAARDFGGEKSRFPERLADSIVTPQVLPSNDLTVDGETVQVIPELTGDVISGVNSVLWIPSLSTVLAADVVFNHVHLWLGSPDSTSRLAWRASLKRIAALHPKVVVAGHKKDVSAPDSPDVLAAVDQYLADYDALRKTAANPQALFDAMQAKYPDYAVSNLLRFAAQVAFRPRAPPR